MNEIFKTIKFTDWGGKKPIEIKVPKICDHGLMEGIFNVILHICDDHNACKELQEFWGIDNKDEWEKFWDKSQIRGGDYD